VVSPTESEHAVTDEELLLELTSKNTTRSIKDFSPEGIRLESNLEGDAKGVYDATFYATITMLVKPDRTIDYEVRQIHTTSDGDTVLVYYKGKSIIEGPTRNKVRGRDHVPDVIKEARMAERTESPARRRVQPGRG
jgi:hypothetical protein